MVHSPSRVFPGMASDDIEPGNGFPADDPIVEAAISWFVRLRDTASGEADRQAFQRWQDLSPLHGQAYAEIREIWADLDALRLPGPLPAELAPARAATAGVPPRRCQTLRWNRGGGLIAALLLALLASGPWSSPSGDLDSRTGEVRRLTLADGSRVELDAQSTINVALTPARREIRLIRGRAWFNVAQERRPFVVAVGAARVRDIGTAFEVGRREAGGDVSVTHGVVELTAAGGTAMRLTVGQSARFTDSGRARLVQSPERLAAWRSGRLQFVDMPLSDVLADLSRHGAGTPLLLGSLGDHRVTGAVDLSDPLAARDAVLARAGAQPRGFAGWYVVIRRAPVMAS